jgi:opacity protein-like surface antigen
MISNRAWRISAVLALGCAGAGAAPQLERDFTEDLFQNGKYELSLNSGVMFSPVGAVKNRSTVNYTLTELQLGWMLTDAGNGSSWYRGNFELVGAVMGGAVYDGKGSYIAGVTALARYNFVPPGSRWVPFVQAGGGAELTDINQDLLGEHFNFNLDVGAGLRYLINQNWSLSAECRYQHLSNAKLAAHDVGINAVGPMISLSHFF